MKKDIRLIALDLDGTVFNSKNQITPRVMAALKAAMQAGIAVVPATGRQIVAVPKEFTEILKVNYALVTNGACIYDLKAKKAIYKDTFDDENAKKIFALCKNLSNFISLFIGGKCFIEKSGFEILSRTVSPSTLKYLRSTRFAVEGLENYIGAGHGAVEKISLLFPNPKQHAHAGEVLKRQIENYLSAGMPSFGLTSSLQDNWEINTATANKGTGLLILGEKLGLAPSQIMAVGDGLNDISMLSMAGHGVAMGQASSEVKAAANDVTASCDEEGVALAIEAILHS